MSLGEEKLLVFKGELAEYLDEILDHCVRRGVGMRKVVLLLWEPGEDQRMVLLTNEEEEETLPGILEVALKHEHV